ncbi:MAG: hypothetical protein AB7S48_09425 [Bacteroidales bacterium]
MPNIRDLKKDVKYMVKHFLDECYTQLAYSPHLNQENIFDIISDVVELQREVISKLSAKSRKRGETVKPNYRSIADEFYNRIVELTERLNSLDY